MARTVNDKNLQSGESRRRLPVRGKPHWRTLEQGLHLGYRRLQNTAGTWTVRLYDVVEKEYTTERIGLADDLSNSNGVSVLSFAEAQAKARQIRDERDMKAAGKGTFTVADAARDYLEFTEKRRKSAKDTKLKVDAFIVNNRIGAIEASKLTTKNIEAWLHDLAETPPRKRTRKGAEQRYREMDDSDEARRRRQSTANRVFAVLKAALNRSFRAGKIPSDNAWRRVEAFGGVEAARVRFLTVAECQRLVNAAAPDFRQLLSAALTTGCRYSELCALRASDFDADSFTIHVRTSKSGKGRRVPLNTEGVALFRSLAAGKAGEALLLVKFDGTAWKRSHQQAPMREACRNGRVSPAVSFHILRHAYASLAVKAGASLAVVAKALGHRDTKMAERFYAHFEKSYVADTIKATAPTFGFEAGNVVGI